MHIHVLAVTYLNLTTTKVVKLAKKKSLLDFNNAVNERFAFWVDQLTVEIRRNLEFVQHNANLAVHQEDAIQQVLAKLHKLLFKIDLDRLTQRKSFRTVVCFMTTAVTFELRRQNRSKFWKNLENDKLEVLYRRIPENYKERVDELIQVVKAMEGLNSDLIIAFIRAVSSKDWQIRGFLFSRQWEFFASIGRHCQRQKCVMSKRCLNKQPCQLKYHEVVKEWRNFKKHIDKKVNG